ncbi:MAG: hypothetical protein HW383_260 [Candidatus Magasanikbacteria bacterium]|nr:hypothetical protein [Candidatus Magasanikbacteria bacterium]
MVTDTERRIYEFIQKNAGVRSQDIINHLRHNPTGVFRHLKKMQENHRIYKVGKPPKVRYYGYAKSMKQQSNLIDNTINWAVSGDRSMLPADQFCQTRDVFQARTDRLINDLKKLRKNDDFVYLLVAAVGEIGNNSFDHNIGHWQDIPGIFFGLDVVGREIVLADRGQGVYATIKRVRPEVESDVDALRIAFTEMVSGREPERRGNGLKFVKKVIEENRLHLTFYSGGAMVEITGDGMTQHNSEIKIPGTLAHLKF